MMSSPNDEWKVRRRNKNHSNIQFAMEDPAIPNRSLSSALVGSPDSKPQDIYQTSPHIPMRKKKVNTEFANKIAMEGFPVKGQNFGPEWGMGSRTRTRDPEIQYVNRSSLAGVGCTLVGMRHEFRDEFPVDLRWEDVNDDYLGCHRAPNTVYQPKYRKLRDAVPQSDPSFDKIANMEARCPTSRDLGISSKRHAKALHDPHRSQIVFGSEPNTLCAWAYTDEISRCGDATATRAASASVRRVRKSVENAPSSNSYRVLDTNLQEVPAAFKPSLRTNIAPVPELEKTDEERGPLKRWEFFSMRR